MANLKSIKQRIRVASETLKVTRVVQLIAAAKFRGAKKSASVCEGYFRDAVRLMADLKTIMFSILVSDDGFDSNDHIQSCFIKKLQAFYLDPCDDVDSINGTDCFIVAVGSNKGLCGNLNSSVAKLVVSKIKDHLVKYQNNSGEKNIYIYSIGAKIANLIRANVRRDLTINLIDDNSYYSEKLSPEKIDLMMNSMLSSWFNCNARDVTIVYHNAKTVLSHDAVSISILSSLFDYCCNNNDSSVNSDCGSYIPAPIIGSNSKDIFYSAISHVFRGAMMSSIHSHISAEYALRMNSMDSATKNGQQLVDNLTLTYNKERQSSITKELIDLIGGVVAMDGVKFLS